MGQSLTVREIAELVEGRLEGNDRGAVTGVAPLAGAGPGEAAFLAASRYAGALKECRAEVVLLREDAPACERPAIRVDDPEWAIIQVIGALGLEANDHPFAGVDERAAVHVEAEVAASAAIAPFATVCRGARIGARSVLYPGVFIGPDVIVGSDCVFFPNVCVLRDCRVGDNVELGPGVVVGADGFGLHPTTVGTVRVPQLGNVVLEDNVSLGANTTIDRARFGTTRVKNGASLDNLVHVAHNCTIGANTIIAAQTGIAGGTSIGARCVLAGQVGVVEHLRIGDGIMIGAKSGVTHSFEGVKAVSGYYAEEHGDMLRHLGALRKVPKLLERVRELEKRLS